MDSTVTIEKSIEKVPNRYKDAFRAYIELMKVQGNISKLLVARNYTNTDGLLEKLESILKGSSPQSEIHRLRQRNGRYYYEDRTEYNIHPNDAKELSESDRQIISGERALYIRSEDEIFVLENIEKSLHTGIIRILEPLIDALEGTLDAIEKINRDELTGLYNDKFIARLGKSLDQSEDIPYLVIMIDMNNLKGLNTIGHHVGDAGLQKTANILHREFARNSNYEARLSGDEFIIIMTFDKDTSEERQKEIAEEKMRRVVESMKSGDNNSGKYLLENEEVELSLRYGISLKSEGADFRSRVKLADERSNIGKSGDGYGTRLLEVIDTVSDGMAWKITRASLGRLGRVHVRLPSLSKNPLK